MASMKEKLLCLNQPIAKGAECRSDPMTINIMKGLLTPRTRCLCDVPYRLCREARE